MLLGVRLISADVRLICTNQAGSAGRSTTISFPMFSGLSCYHGRQNLYSFAHVSQAYAWISTDVRFSLHEPGPGLRTSKRLDAVSARALCGRPVFPHLIQPSFVSFQAYALISTDVRLICTNQAGSAGRSTEFLLCTPGFILFQRTSESHIIRLCSPGVRFDLHGRPAYLHEPGGVHRAQHGHPDAGRPQRAGQYRHSVWDQVCRQFGAHRGGDWGFSQSYRVRRKIQTFTR